MKRIVLPNPPAMSEIEPHMVDPQLCRNEIVCYRRKGVTGKTFAFLTKLRPTAFDEVPGKPHESTEEIYGFASIQSGKIRPYNLSFKATSTAGAITKALEKKRNIFIFQDWEEFAKVISRGGF